MNSKIIITAILAVIVGFAAGFLVANSLNRSQLESALSNQARTDSGLQSGDTSASDMQLSQEEIQAKIAEADRNADNFEYQKTLGLALYTYAAMKQDASLLDSVSRLLARAHKLNPDDYDVLVSYGNISFDLGQLRSDEKLNERSRELYEKALEKNEKDTNVNTSIGVSHLVAKEPDPKTAIRYLSTAIETDSKNSKAIRYLAQAYADSGDMEQAGKFLKELKDVDPENAGIAELERKISAN